MKKKVSVANSNNEFAAFGQSGQQRKISSILLKSILLKRGGLTKKFKKSILAINYNFGGLKNLL